MLMIVALYTLLHASEPAVGVVDSSAGLTLLDGKSRVWLVLVFSSETGLKHCSSFQHVCARICSHLLSRICRASSEPCMTNHHLLIFPALSHTVFLLNFTEITSQNFDITDFNELVVVTFIVPQTLRAPSTRIFVVW